MSKTIGTCLNMCFGGWYATESTRSWYVCSFPFRPLLTLQGGAIAVLGGGLLGTVGSGIAFFAAPSMGVGIGIGVVTAMVKVRVHQDNADL